MDEDIGTLVDDNSHDGVPPYATARVLQQFLDRLFDLLYGYVAREPLHLVPVFEEEIGGQGHHFQLQAEAPVLRGFHLGHLDPTRIRGAECLNLRQGLEARDSLGAPEIDEHGQGGLDDFRFKGVGGEILHGDTPWCLMAPACCCDACGEVRLSGWNG